jgi:hypothetical protein
VCRRRWIRLRDATIGFFGEDRRIFMLRRSLFTFRPICVLDEYHNLVLHTVDLPDTVCGVYTHKRVHSCVRVYGTS